MQAIRKLQARENLLRISLIKVQAGVIGGNFPIPGRHLPIHGGHLPDGQSGISRELCAP